jgi:uncharacterized repeat protein (TIGR03943 family)
MQITNQTNMIDTRSDPARAREWGKAALLGGLTLYFGYTAFSGNITNYVNERFGWLSYVATLLFAVLFLAVSYGLLRDGSLPRATTGRTIGWPALLIVTVPLLLGTLLPSRPLGASAVQGNMSFRAVAVGDARGLTRDPLDRNVLEWRRVFETDSAAAFEGQQADVVGFVYREPGYPENMFVVARFTMSCCVADASAIGLPVRVDDPAAIREGDWVRVQGAFEAGSFDGLLQPILLAAAVEVVDQPKHPYLYP